MHDQSWDVELFEILAEVGRRESFDAIVSRFNPAHHPLSPPVVDHALGDFRTWTVETIERTTGEILEELRAVSEQCSAKTIKDIQRQPARVGGRLDHQRRHSADQHSFGDAASAAP